MYLIVEGSQSAEFLQGQITIDVEKISDKEYTPLAFVIIKAGSLRLSGLKVLKMDS